MSNKFFKSIFAFAMVLGTALGFVGCTPEEETKADPKVELSASTLNFSAAEESKTVNVTSNSNWTVTVDENATWVDVTPTSGKNKGTITVHVAENTTGAARTTKVKVSALHPEYGGWDHKQITINQSADENEAVEEEVLYSDDFDGAEATMEYGSSNSSWPYIDQFVDFVNKQGPASVDVLYEGNKVSVRANEPSSSENYSTYAGSGVNNIFFGDGGYFVVKNIAPLKADSKNYKISFGLYKNKDGLAFENKQFLLYISKDAEKWAPVEYTVGTMEGSKFSVATADFTLTTLPERLHIKFVAREASVFRIDDLKFYAGNGGQNIDLDNVVEVAPELPEMTEVTAEQFLAAAEDATIYKLTGEITRVVNATYGNFDITDATGTVYVYGLLTPTGEAQKQFAAAGLKQGDTITVYGTRTSYNGDPQMKNATYISHVAGEGGNDEPNTPATGVYASDSAFVCSADDSTNAAYSLGSTTIGGESVTGFKLGKGQQAGKFTSGAVSVSGNKYLNFYAQGWKGGDVTLYYRVDGGATMSQKLVSNDGVTGNPPFKALVLAETDHYSVLLEGLTETSKIEFSTDANFELTTASSTMASARAIVFGVKLSDEPIAFETPSEPENPGTEEDPENPADPADVITIAEVLALGQGATINGVIEGVVVSNLDLNNLTSKKGMYVQDETGALQFFLAANHSFAFGTKVQIDLTGATLGNYNGAVQVSGLALEKITAVSTGNTVEPKTVAMADFLANKYEGQYVALEGVQVVAADLAKTWVSGNAHTNINMEDAQGNKFIVFSSKYAAETYGDETVAQGSGTIKGIASINNGNIQIIFAQASDYAGLTGERFATVTPEPEPTPDPTPGEDPVAGDVVVLTMSDYFSADEEIVGKTYTFGDFTFSFTQNNTNVSNYKASDPGLRFYQNDVMKIDAGSKTMTKIEFETYGGKTGPFTSTIGSVDGTTWTGSASVVELTASAQVRFKKVTITLAE